LVGLLKRLIFLIEAGSRKDKQINPDFNGVGFNFAEINRQILKFDIKKSPDRPII